MTAQLAGGDLIEVDVIIDVKAHHHLMVRTDETAPSQYLSRDQVRILSTRGEYATIRLPERTAIKYNLV